VEHLCITAQVMKTSPLTDFSGKVIAVDPDPRFALILKIKSVQPRVKDFAQDAEVTFAIHSTSLVFSGAPQRGRTYGFCLTASTERDVTRYSHLTVATMGQTSEPGGATHGECAENDQNVGYPLKGWVGYTNTDESVPDMKVDLLASSDGPPIATTTTDAVGRFSFPTATEGRFFLKATKKLVGEIVSADSVVVVRKGETHIVCLVAEGEYVEQTNSH